VVARTSQLGKGLFNLPAPLPCLRSPLRGLRSLSCRLGVALLPQPGGFEGFCLGLERESRNGFPLSPFDDCPDRPVNDAPRAATTHQLLVEASGVVKCDTLVATSVVASSYTAGERNRE
jgi:hypothetical protein